MTHTIVGFGASSMQGIGDEEQGGFFNRLLASVDQARWVNLGVGGDTTRDMLRRCHEVKAYRPYDLIVLLGCNDYPRANDAYPEVRATLEEYAANLTRLLPSIRGQRNIFITSFEVDPVRSGVSAATFERYISRARAIALDSGYEVIDLYAMLKVARLDYLAADGVHFTGHGHQVIADLVKSTLGATIDWDFSKPWYHGSLDELRQRRAANSPTG